MDDENETVYIRYKRSVALDRQFDKLSQMISSGEIAGYVPGNSTFLVWKYALTGINALSSYKFAI